MNDNTIDSIKSAIPIYNDWPKQGVQYMNTVELCSNPKAFYDSIGWFAEQGRSIVAKDIFAADARGFIWGAPTATALNVPMHVVRKPGKLPGAVHKQSYTLEYGTDTLEMSAKIPHGDRNVMVIDDVLATGGTAEAICKLLIEKLGIAPSSITVAVLVNLTFLPGEALLKSKNINVKGLINA